MPKSERLIELIMAVNRRKRFTVQEMADEFGVSRRTMLRDLQALSELGVPLYSEHGPGGGYRLLRERLLPPLAFTEGEAVAMFFACQALRHYESLPFEDASRSALGKFYEVLPDDTKRRIDRMTNRVDFAETKRGLPVPYLKTLLDSAVDSRRMEIEYDGKKGRESRSITPIGVYAANGFWYCRAYCHDRQAYRLYRVDRVLEVKKTVGEDEVRAGVHLGNWSEQSDEPMEWMEIDVSLTREGVRRCRGEWWIGDQLKVAPDGSGRLAARVPRSDLVYFAHFFLGFGSSATVAAPAQLAEEIRLLLRRTAEAYERGSACELNDVPVRP